MVGAISVDGLYAPLSFGLIVVLLGIISLSCFLSSQAKKIDKPEKISKANDYKFIFVLLAVWGLVALLVLFIGIVYFLFNI